MLPVDREGFWRIYIRLYICMQLLCNTIPYLVASCFVVCLVPLLDDSRIRFVNVRVAHEDVVSALSEDTFMGQLLQDPKSILGPRLGQ